jgi:cbb3-type cytochrome oxidase cytochrome c subunit
MFDQGGRRVRVRSVCNICHFQLAVSGEGLRLGTYSSSIIVVFRSGLEWALGCWEAPATAALLTRLGRQVCHGDANEMNVLVRGQNGVRVEGG